MIRFCAFSGQFFPKFALQKGKIFDDGAPYIRVEFHTSKSHTCVPKSGFDDDGVKDTLYGKIFRHRAEP